MMKKRGDRVYTPEHVARDMIETFLPAGRVLEPFKGDGVFTRLRKDWDWCEIEEGRDFFDWRAPVDWVMSNPPYSKLRPVWNHAASIAENIVYLIPFRNWVSGHGFLVESFTYGNPVHIRMYGTGGSIGFPMGNAIVAVHWRRGYRGATSWSFYTRASSTRTDDRRKQ